MRKEIECIFLRKKLKFTLEEDSVFLPFTRLRLFPKPVKFYCDVSISDLDDLFFTKIFDSLNTGNDATIRPLGGVLDSILSVTITSISYQKGNMLCFSGTVIGKMFIE